MDSYDRTDLLLCIEGLGGLVRLEAEDGSEALPVYHLGPDAVGCLQDLQRFLRRDDSETKAFHVQLGSWNVVSTHLLAMLTSHRENFEVVFEVLKLLVMLTMPADSKLRNPTQYKLNLALYKEAFVNADIISIILGVAAIPLSRIGMERTHQDIQVIELVLTLFRNLLAIQPSRPNVNDEFMAVMDKEHVFMLVLHLLSQADAPENARFPLLLLEFVSLALAHQDAFLLASSPDISLEPHTPLATVTGKSEGAAHSKSYAPAPLAASMGSPTASLPGSTDGLTRPSLQSHMSSKGAALAAALEAASKPQLGASPSSAAPRHSRFGGYVVSSPVIKSNVRLTTLVEKPKDAIGDEAADPEKGRKPRADRSKRPLRNTEWTDIPTKTASSLISIAEILAPKLDSVRKSKTAFGSPSAANAQTAGASSGSFVTRILLKRFTRSIMEYGYNTLMGVIKSLVVSHSPSVMDTDLDHYVWAIGFFPAFVSSDYKRALNDAIEARKSPTSDIRNVPEAVEFDAGSFQTIFEESTFYYLLEQLERYETEKNAAKVEVHFLALKNLIFTLLALYESNLSEMMRIAESIVMKLIYNPELLVDRLPRLVRTFTNMKRGQRLLLPHLIEGVHLFLTVLERISENGLKKLVQLKKRAKGTMGSGKFLAEDEEHAYKALDDDLDDIGVVNHDIREESQMNVDGDSQEGGVESKKSQATGSNEGESETGYGDNEESERKNRVQDMLKQLQEEEDDEDAAQDEKYFDVQDYIAFYSKQSIINAIMELLKAYDSNLERTNEAALGMLKRIRAVGGMPMLFQVSHLRVFASMLTDSEASKLGPAARELRTFARELTAVFLDRFSEDPVTFGLTSLVPKKLSYAKDLDEGLYLTYNSSWDGTIQNYEDRRAGTGFREPPEDEDLLDDLHTINPSRLSSSYNQRARPYLGEGLQGNAEFDLGTLLSAPTAAVHPSRLKITKEERIEAKWKELQEANSRSWTEEEEAQLQGLYASYQDLDESDLVPMILSMMNPVTPMTSADVYLKLMRMLEKEEFAKLKRPALEPDVMAAIEAAGAAVTRATSSVKPVRAVQPSKPRARALDEDDDAEVRVTAPVPRAFSEDDRLSDSEGDTQPAGGDEGGADAGTASKGKTAKQLRDEMRKRALDLQALEKKRREEMAVLTERRREERAEQKAAREAGEAVAKEKRLQEKALAKEEKVKQRTQETEEKAAAKRAAKEAREREKSEAKARNAEERQRNRGDNAVPRVKRQARRPAADSLDAEEGEERNAEDFSHETTARTGDASSDSSESIAATPKRVARPKRAAATRTKKKMSDFDRYLEGLDSSDEPVHSPSSSSEEDTAAPSSAQQPSELHETKNGKSSETGGADLPDPNTAGKKKGKRKRGNSGNDDEDYVGSGGAGSEDEERFDADNEHGAGRHSKTKRSASTASSSKRTSSAKNSSKADNTKSPAKKKPKLSTAASQTDSAPLEDLSAVISPTISDINQTATPTKRRLVKPAKPADDDDDLDLSL